MKRLAAAALLAVTASACASAEVVVLVQVDDETLEGIEVQLLPYDRDHLFDSLGAVYAEAERPEPEIPEELRQARTDVQEAQGVWRTLELEWSGTRSRLQTISGEMEQYSRGERRYQELFTEFNTLEGRLTRIERDKDRAFEAFTELQVATVAQSRAVQMQRDIWADEAYANITEVIELKLAEAGADRMYDTTDASGVARGTFMVAPGEYWVHARYELVYTELYWNLPITIEGSEPVTITLGRENAEERAKL
ncbi:MAG: hypothetical protein J4G12_10075 [Gemmatimonadetes bacterium]|nr:hypothetical protein [Gemmatimonadota bacterium]